MLPVIAVVCLAVLGSVPVYSQNMQAPVAADFSPSMLLRARPGREQGCTYFRGDHRHGETFSVPGTSHCIQYICWHGTVRLRKEACEVNGECIGVGSQRQTMCSIYQCHKTVEGRVNRYQTTRLSSGCRDMDGGCHKPGEIFPFVMGGRRYNNCTCSVMDSDINYTCTNRRW